MVDSKLTPEERIKQLKKLEAKLKEEISQARDMIKDSEKDMEVESKSKKPKIKEKPQEKIQEVRKKGLEAEVEKPVVTELEKTIMAENPQLSKEEINQRAHYEVVNYFSKQPAYNMQQEVGNLHDEIIQQINQGYGVTDEQKSQLYAMKDAFDEKQTSIDTGSYSPTNDARESLDVAGGMLKKLINNYLK